MLSSKALALFALAIGVNASAEYCSANETPRAGLTCGAPGYVIDDSYRIKKPEFLPTVEDCALACYNNGPCWKFTYWDDGFCQLFMKYFGSSSFIFNNNAPEARYYDVDCFYCPE